ncbi:MAG: hypothetical protein EPN21_08315 [Methylococcaceae bacterium]|nr:MAG: hypothetical protein EPN21_08315 [Methylococcaceae bacterium]
MNFEQNLGLGDKPLDHDPQAERKRLQLYINLKLSSTGQPTTRAGDDEFMSIAHDLLKSYREKNRLLTHYLCPIDRRIQAFLDGYLQDLGPDEGKLRLPSNSLVLDRYGVARELSLPADGDVFTSDIVSSYRIRQGILHNPANDRRTTEGSFHIAEGGLPIPGDKKAVPKLAFARLLASALNPPETLLQLPFSAHEAHKARLFVSLLLRPVICPEIPTVAPAKSMEIRFFAPGNLVSNLDFVESIFGNAGNPYLPENDAALDVTRWSGHTGCVILAPHLTRLSKKALGLPHYSEAGERARRDGMCWQDEAELYNNGNAFKITARDRQGVIVTILADNYYGYCKKEVKTQISYAANLFGLAEEEHAGGALAFPRHNHGEEFGVDSRIRQNAETFTFAKMLERYGECVELQPQGYAVDKQYPDLLYVPLDISVDLRTQTISWHNEAGKQQIKLRPGKTYMQPNGYKIEMHKHPKATSWRLIGTDAEGVFCHKPCTVSGGGKSEISKSIDDAVIYGPVFVQDFEADMQQVTAIFNRDYRDRLKPEFSHEDRDPSRRPLSPERSLGSVIKLLTPSPSNTDAYNAWLATLPPHILSQVFIIKRFYKKEWGDSWREHLSVDVINGMPGHALKLEGRELVASYLRVGLGKSGNWLTYKVRQDFIATEKIQMEDDISASVVVSRDVLPNLSPKSNTPSVKLVKNCEYRLFQRPDDAIHRGFDKQTESDMAQPNNFIANFEPLIGDKLAEIVEDVVEFQKYTAPMREVLQAAYQQGDQYVVSSASPRLVDGKPSKNPRYLQIRPDLQKPIRTHIAEMGARLARQLPLQQKPMLPVNAVLTGRRNNPPEPGIRSLAVYNPIHYQELPELFMDFICSVTGKSPSTTGAGSEGALTKGPFNALRATADLNNALVSFIVTGYAGFSSAAGYIGPNRRVDHDISLLIPEIWARLEETERQPEYLIKEGYLEALHDFDYAGQRVLASRLGYRITDRFVAAFMGKIFDNPAVAMDEAILKPETQDMAVYVDGINNIVEAQQRAAQHYLDDGSIEDACPPLKALLYIMASGVYQGKDVHHPDVRKLFSREYLLNSHWYALRLDTKQQRDIVLWQRHCDDLQAFLALEGYEDVAETLEIEARLQEARAKLAHCQSAAYRQSLQGTIGADLLGGYEAD